MKRALAAAYALALSLGSAGASAQSDVETANLIDWFYGPAFGTGVYRVGDKTAALFRIPLSHTLREVDDERKWGLKLLFPISVGLYDFDLSSVLDENIAEKVGIVAVLPGAEFLVPVRENWMLRPFVQLGGGKQINTSGGAAIYAVGVRSRTNWLRGRDEFILGGELQQAGFRTSDNLVSNLTRVGLGGELIVPTSARAAGRKLNFGTYLAYYHYFNDFDALFPGGNTIQTQAISDEVELGFTIGAYQPFKIFGFPLKRIGIGFRIGQDLRGIRFSTGLPF